MSDSKKEIIDRAIQLLKSSEISGYQINQDTGLTEASVSNWRNEKNKPSFPNAKILLDYLGKPESLPIENYDGKGSPYYDVDFVGGFDLVVNDQTVNPDYYINLPPYNNDGVIWCNLYGKSMEPRMFSGDRIAVKEVSISDILFGKVYGVITNTGMRTVKWVVRSPDDKDCYRLIPENEDPKYGDYQDIKIKDIYKMYLILVSIRPSE